MSAIAAQSVEVGSPGELLSDVFGSVASLLNIRRVASNVPSYQTDSGDGAIFYHIGGCDIFPYVRWQTVCCHHEEMDAYRAVAGALYGYLLETMPDDFNSLSFKGFVARCKIVPREIKAESGYIDLESRKFRRLLRVRKVFFMADQAVDVLCGEDQELIPVQRGRLFALPVNAGRIRVVGEIPTTFIFGIF